MGELLRSLESAGKLENSLVIVTSDHGEEFFDHGSVSHGMSLYQEQLHVPLILSGPGVSPRTIPDMVSTVDIVPTLLDLVGLPHEGYGGRSLRALLEGGTLAPATAYADQVNGYDWNASMVGARPDAAFLYTVCDGVWKLTYRPHMPGSSELFHLQQDPGEEHNRIDEEHEVYLRLMGDLAERMMTALEAAQGEGGDIRGKQSAALLVVSGDENEPAWAGRIFDLRVEDQAEPLIEMRHFHLRLGL